MPLENLVKDVYRVLETDGTEILLEYKSKIANQGSKAYLRMSNVGQPARKVWLDIHSGHSQVVDGQLRLKFILGDLVEALLIPLIAKAGYTVENIQASLELGGIKGHADCTVNGYPLDVKSASTWAFKKFQSLEALREDDPFGYEYQVRSYATALDKDRGYLLALDKSNCELALLEVPNDSKLTTKHVSRRKAALSAATSHTDFPICYEDKPLGESGNRELATGCVFCPHKLTCWDGLRAFQYSGKVKYLTVVEKQPNVEEIPLDDKRN